MVNNQESHYIQFKIHQWLLYNLLDILTNGLSDLFEKVRWGNIGGGAGLSWVTILLAGKRETLAQTGSGIQSKCKQ